VTTEPELGQLISKLLAKTRERRVPWQKTERERFFSAQVGDLDLRVASSGEASVAIGLSANTGSSITWYTFLKSAPGRADPFFDEVKELYDLARNAALGLDRQLQKAIEVLDQL
jgi:hypothetical protein